MTGQQLRNKRTELGLSQTALAELLEVRQATVSGWETGAKAISHVVELALMEIERRVKGKKS